MTRVLMALLLALWATPLWAQTPPPMPGSDARIRTLPYDADRVIPLAVAANFQLTVLFTGEQVENVAVGDSDAWQVTLNRRGDALFLKPLRTGGVTNMTVITSTRVYSFELSSAHGASPSAPFTVRFSTPEQSDAAKPAVVGRYRLSGARALRPVAISDDGDRTFIDWGSTQAIPALFGVDERGNEILLEGHMRDGRYVVDAVHRSLVFRLDRQTARASRNHDGASR